MADQKPEFYTCWLARFFSTITIDPALMQEVERWSAIMHIMLKQCIVHKNMSCSQKKELELQVHAYLV